MISRNLIQTIIIFLIIGAVIYIVYDNSKLDQKSILTEKQHKKHSKKHKKVSFNDHVKYHYYDKKIPTHHTKKSRIDIDDILYRSSEEAPQSRVVSIEPEKEDDYKINTVFPSNLEQDTDEAWDVNFGSPLVNKNERKTHFDRMQKNNKNYFNSISDFSEYQTDRSSLVEPEFKIDPFKPDRDSKQLSGQRIRDIYDAQVVNPSAKPKQIKTRTDNLTTYVDDDVSNGGMIPGTNLCGYDGMDNVFKSSAFGNEF